MALSDHWTGFALDEAFKTIREDIYEVRDEAKSNRTELKQRIEEVSNQCHDDHKAVIARLDSQDSARDAARLETRKAIITFAGVLLAALIAAGAGLLAGGPPV